MAEEKPLLPKSSTKAEMGETLLKRQSAPKMKSEKKGNVVVNSFSDNTAAGFQEVYKSFGTREKELIEVLLSQLSPIFFGENTKERDANALLAALHSIAPRDALEALLVSQMIACQTLAMKFLHLSALENQTFEGKDAYVNRATKLMRTFTQQMDALTRYRNRGQQHVTVQHVQVNGQAIIGAMNHSEGEGG